MNWCRKCGATKNVKHRDYRGYFCNDCWAAFSIAIADHSRTEKEICDEFNALRFLEPGEVENEPT